MRSDLHPVARVEHALSRDAPELLLQHTRLQGRLAFAARIPELELPNRHRPCDHDLLMLGQLGLAPDAAVGGILIVGSSGYDDLSLFEFAQVQAVLGARAPAGVQSWYDVIVAAEGRRPVRLAGGARLSVEHGLDAFDRADTVVVPGWSDVAVPASIAAALARAHARDARVVSICTGAMALAAAGLLGRRRATTHWRHIERLRGLDPTIRVEEAPLYIDEGSVVTSAGAAAGLDMLLHLVRRDHGCKAANAVARGLVIPAHRDGDQSQFIERPVAAPGDDRLARVMAYVRANLAREHDVGSMAARAAMSPRTFHRHFRAATGLSPTDWLVRERVLAARASIERNGPGLEALAPKVGFGSADLLRHHFRRVVGVTPSSYRRTFASAITNAQRG